jgi:hypothetical protein
MALGVCLGLLVVPAAAAAQSADELAKQTQNPVASLIWGAGPVFLLPAATNTSLGSEKFRIGPSAVALAQPGKWTNGGLFNHIWLRGRESLDSGFVRLPS